jgi:hypothetical protein
MRKRKRWSYSAGAKGATITVFEREPGGMLYARAWDPTMRSGRGGYRRITLKHQDREAAKTYALEQAKKLREGLADLTAGRTTLARVFGAYLAHRSPKKTAGQEAQDRRRVKLWTAALGGQRDPHLIPRALWESVLEARAIGAVDAYGEPVPEGKRRPVRARAVEVDAKWLKAVLTWSTSWQDERGRYLLRENVIRGYPVPTEKNPRRPVASQERFEALRAVSDQVPMELRWNGGRPRLRSYLSELLDIVNGTGRRISAVCQLRYEDLRLDQKPHGAIRWPAETEAGTRNSGADRTRGSFSAGPGAP